MLTAVVPMVFRLKETQIQESTTCHTISFMCERERRFVLRARKQPGREDIFQQSVSFFLDIS